VISCNISLDFEYIPHYYTLSLSWKLLINFMCHLPNHLCATVPSWFVCAIYLCPHSIIKNLPLRVSQLPHYYTPPQTKAFYQFYGHLPNHLCAMWPSWFVCAIHLCPYSIIKKISSHVSQSPHYYTPSQIEAFYQSYGCGSSPWSNVCYVGLIVHVPLPLL